MLRTLAVIMCGVFLCFSLVGANVALGVDRGPMDPDHAAASLEEAEVYAHVHAELLDVIEEEIGDRELEGTDVDLGGVVRDVIGPDLLRAQVERNADRVYTYLEDDSAELVVSLDQKAIRSAARAAVDEELQTVDYAEFGFPELDAMLANPSSYETERLEIRSDLLAEFGADRSSGFGQQELAELIASEERYDAQRTAYRERIVSAMLAEAEAETGFGHPEVEALLESEASYTASQDQFRADRKEEIQEETDRELSDEELERAYEDRENDIVDAAAAEAEESVTFEEAPSGYEPPTGAFAQLTAEALATDLSYGEFQDRYDEELAVLEENLVEYVATGGADVASAVADQGTVELPENVPGKVAEEADALEALVIESTTSDMSYGTFMGKYEEIGAELETAIAGYAWDEREEYADEIDERLALPADVPDPVAEELTTIRDATLEAALTDLAYEDFESQVDGAEESIVDALVTYAFEEEEIVPNEVDLTEDVEQEAGEAVDLARTAGAALGWAVIGLVLLSGAFVLGIVAAARSTASASVAVGVVSSIVGGASFAGASVLPGFIEDGLAEADVPSNVAPAIPDLVGALLSPWATQSLVLLGIGILLVIGGIVLKLGLVGGDGSGDDVAAE